MNLTGAEEVRSPYPSFRKERERDATPSVQWGGFREQKEIPGV